MLSRSDKETIFFTYSKFFPEYWRFKRPDIPNTGNEASKAGNLFYCVDAISVCRLLIGGPGRQNTNPSFKECSSVQFSV